MSIKPALLLAKTKVVDQNVLIDIGCSPDQASYSCNYDVAYICYYMYNIDYLLLFIIVSIIA